MSPFEYRELLSLLLKMRILLNEPFIVDAFYSRMKNVELTKVTLIVQRSKEFVRSI